MLIRNSSPVETRLGCTDIRPSQTSWMHLFVAVFLTCSGRGVITKERGGGSLTTCELYINTVVVNLVLWWVSRNALRNLLAQHLFIACLA